MNKNTSCYEPGTIEAIFLAIVSICILSFGIIQLEATPHIPILTVIIFFIFYGLLRGIPFKQLEQGLVNGAISGIGAVFLLFFIGLLIACWMISGTIPTLMYTGFGITTNHYFYAVVFIVTAMIGIGIGSSLTTVGTIGVAFISIALTMDISLSITAGAIVSGAFFGDKMSPLSDTTNLASTVLKVDLFEHIRNMCWTTIPTFLISLIFFTILSPTLGKGDFEKINTFKDSLMNTGLIHWYSWIPLIILLILSIKSVPAFLSLSVSSILAVFLSFFHRHMMSDNLPTILYKGYVSNTGNQAIDELLTRGGINSMFFTITLVLLALGMGGLFFTLGIIPRIIHSIEKLLKSVSSVITASALTAIGINTLIGEQYLAILLTGESFQSQYERLGLANKNLSRVLEDAGTVVNPLVPWSVCGVFITSVLGVSTIDYLPFAFFCLISPIMSILFGFTGKTLTYLK